MKLIQSATNFDSLAGPPGAARPTRRRSSPHTASNGVPVGFGVGTSHSPKANTLGSTVVEETVKKRVRLKPESREQLLERLRNPPLSLHEAAILLRVSRATVRRYADAGRLPCQRTDGGQRRFCLRDIENFYRQLKLKR